MVVWGSKRLMELWRLDLQMEHSPRLVIKNISAHLGLSNQHHYHQLQYHLFQALLLGPGDKRCQLRLHSLNYASPSSWGQANWDDYYYCFKGEYKEKGKSDVVFSLKVCLRRLTAGGTFACGQRAPAVTW